MILRDDIAHHRKFLKAGALLGGANGAARAFTVYVAAIGYARANLTDGVIDDVFLDHFLLEKKAKNVANVLANPAVGLFKKRNNHFKIHDFADHNGSAAKLRRLRKLARARMRKYRNKQAVEKCNAGFSTGGSVTRHRVRNSEKDKDKEKEVRTYVDQGTYSPLNELRKKVHRLRRHVNETEPADDGNFRVIERLAHVVMDESGLTDPADPELTAQLKTACAVLNIDYGRTVDPDVVVRALTAAAHARLHGKRPS